MASHYVSLEAAHADGWVSFYQAAQWAADVGLVMDTSVAWTDPIGEYHIAAPDGSLVARSTIIVITGPSSSLGGRYRSYMMFPREALKLTSEEA